MEIIGFGIIGLLGIACSGAYLAERKELSRDLAEHCNNMSIDTYNSLTHDQQHFLLQRIKMQNYIKEKTRRVKELNKVYKML